MLLIEKKGYSAHSVPSTRTIDDAISDRLSRGHTRRTRARTPRYKHCNSMAWLHRVVMQAQQVGMSSHIHGRDVNGHDRIGFVSTIDACRMPEPRTPDSDARDFAKLLDAIRAEHKGDTDVARATLFFGMLLNRNGFEALAEFIEIATYLSHDDSFARTGRLPPGTVLPKHVINTNARMVQPSFSDGWNRREVLAMLSAPAIAAVGLSACLDGYINTKVNQAIAAHPQTPKEDRFYYSAMAGLRGVQVVVGGLAMPGAAAQIIGTLRARQEERYELINSPEFKAQLVSILRCTPRFIPAYLDWMERRATSVSR